MENGLLSDCVKLDPKIKFDTRGIKVQGCWTMHYRITQYF